MNETMKFYTGLIEKALALSIDEDASVNDIRTSRSSPEKVVVRPVMVANQRLVMPTEKRLAGNVKSWEGAIAFHPLSESLTRGESEVLQWLKEVICRRLNYIMAAGILEIAMLVTQNAELSPDMARTTSVLKKMDAKSFDDLNAIITAGAEKRESYMINIYLRRDGQLGETKYRRLAVVTFPLLEELQSDSPTVKGVKVRKQDRLNYVELIKAIVPSADKDGMYNFGSNADVAPYLTSLLGAMESILTATNAANWMFGKVSETMAALQIDLSFMDDYKPACLKHMQIPVLQGNIGEGGNDIAPVQRINRDTVNEERSTSRFSGGGASSDSRFGRDDNRRSGSRFGGSGGDDDRRRNDDRNNGSRFGGGRDNWASASTSSRFGAPIGNPLLQQDRTSRYATGDADDRGFSRFGGSRRM